MKQTIFLLIVLFFLVLPASVCSQEICDVVGPELVQNGSFEDITDTLPSSFWFSDGPDFSSDTATFIDGLRSVRVIDSDGSRAIFGQQIDLLPGRMYAYEVWARTQGLDGMATVCVEWADAGGSYLGGDYRALNSAVGGDSDWTLVSHVSTRVLDEAASGSVSCYLTGAQIGTAWWDVVSVRRVWQRPVYSLVTVPSYRGWIFDDGPDHLEVRYRFLWDDVEGGRAAVRLEARLTPAAGDEALAMETVSDLPDTELFLDMELPELSPGQYLLKSELVADATGEILYQDIEPIERRTGPRPPIYVDEHNRLIVEGEPFFPLGMYWGGVQEAQLERYTEGPFNCMMPYNRLSRDNMDLVDGFGLKVIYSIKDFYYGTTWCPDFITSEDDEEGAVRQWVQDYRDHPALIGWYLNDERPLCMLPRLEAHYRWVVEEDDNHPAWIVHFQPGDFVALTDSFDTVGADPYPIRSPSSTPELAARWARSTNQSVANARALWMVPQVFAINGQAPTLEQMRSMTWQCIAEGAMGLIYYSWFEMWDDEANPFEERWPDVKQVAQEVYERVPALLSIEPTPDLEVEGPEAVHWTIRRYLETVYLFVVNDNVDPAGATVRFSQRPESVTLDGVEISIAADGSFEAALESLGVNIYEITIPVEMEEDIPEIDADNDSPVDAFTDADGAEDPGADVDGDGEAGGGCGCRVI